MSRGSLAQRKYSEEGLGFPAWQSFELSRSRASPSKLVTFPVPGELRTLSRLATINGTRSGYHREASFLKVVLAQTKKSAIRGLMDSTKLANSLAQWRDSLINLTNRNRLLNYKKSRSSLDFSDLSASEVYARVLSRGSTFVQGTRPEKSNAGTKDQLGELEELVIEEFQGFDYTQHKDSLFVDLTQREVDRILRAISSASRREFLEKGLSPLYLALGFLRWIDDDGDARKSPLILVPVDLISAGAKRPIEVKRNENDISVNPALSIKMLEHELFIPSSESVNEAFEGNGVGSALALFQSLELPKGWEIEDSATLAVFGFQKEAMYRDLLDNEATILESPVIRALGGFSSKEASDFYFEPFDESKIDELAPPETTPLVLDADASQRVAIAAATSGKSFVLDGPPGTGKSQTISNIIGALIAEGKSVLFVSEKIVALEVVKSRLSQRGLDAFVFELHSHKTTRKEVAKHLGEALAQKPVMTSAMSSQDLEEAKQLRRDLNEYALAMNEVRQPLGLSVFDAIGQLAALDLNKATPLPSVDIRNLSLADFAELRKAIERVALQWHMHLDGEANPWFGLERESGLDFLIDRAITRLAAFEKSYSPIHSAARSLRLDGTIAGQNLHEVVETWAQGSELQDYSWLSTEDLNAYAEAILEIEVSEEEINDLLSKLHLFLGESWKKVPADLGIGDEADFSSLNSVASDWMKMKLSLVPKLYQHIGNALEAFDLAKEGLSAVCESLGVTQPKKLKELENFYASLGLLDARQMPPTNWLKGRRNLANAREALLALRPITEAVGQQRLRASAFLAESLELDLQGLLSFFSQNTNPFSKFSRDYREKKRQLRSVSTVRNWKSLLSSLPLAVEWQSSVQRLNELETIHSAQLTPVYRGKNTDWDFVEELIQLAEGIAVGIQIENAERFEDALDTSTIVDSVLSTRSNLELWLGKWDSLVNFETCRPSEATAGISLIEVRALLEKSKAELAPLLELNKDILELLRPQISISQAVDGFLARRDLDLAVNRVSEKVRDLITPGHALPGDLLSGEKDASKFLERKLSWTKRMREVVNKSRGTLQADAPLTKIDFEAMQEIELPSDFRDSAVAWDEAWSMLRSAFDSSRAPHLDEQVQEFRQADLYLKHLHDSEPQIEAWLDLKKSLETLRGFGLEEAVDEASKQQLDKEVVARYLLKSILHSWVNSQILNDPRVSEDPIFGRSRAVEEYRSLDIKLRDHSVAEIVRKGADRRPRSAKGEAGVIVRESQKKVKHIPVKELITSARNVIQSLQPCFMMSPLAVSQYLPADLTFDVVIFDEASQITPAEAINCVYRGNAIITAGDQKQLPPMSFFSAAGLEEELEEDLARDFDSVLDLMKASGSFNSLTLNWHYRSRHEHLIAYSNSAFYQNKLITYPGSIQDSKDLGVKFIKVDGVYRRSAGQDNPKEAIEVAKRVVHHYKTRPELSLGVVAFSTAQRDAIENAVSLERNRDPSLDALMKIDRRDGFFVNSLESVQGDERDVIIFSIGYGPDSSGKVYKNFGPLNRVGGERRLNVAITRAKQLVEIVASMTAAEMGEVENEGARHLRKYLDFAERGPEALELELGESGLGTESPFEDSVISAVRSWGYEVQPQVGVSGYRVDIGVKHPNSPGTFILGIECDGAMYHSSRAARDRDRLRHEILEGLGWKIHHIWGTAWYRNRDGEMEKLKLLLEQQAALPLRGRLVDQSKEVQTPFLEVALERSQQRTYFDWSETYRIAEVSAIPSQIDLSHPGSASHLVDFVTNVVSIEQPIHFDLLLARLRGAASIGKVGRRIQETLLAAIRLSNVEVEGDFIWLAGSRDVKVRRPAGSNVRDISVISDSELRAAIRNVIADSVGIEKNEIARSLGQVFGWKRIGAQIQRKSDEIVDELLAEKSIELTGYGFKTTV
jgi:very-short-patch-repair endonuclease